jgi:hypothetical protein
MNQHCRDIGRSGWRLLALHQAQGLLVNDQLTKTARNLTGKITFVNKHRCFPREGGFYA